MVRNSTGRSQKEPQVRETKVQLHLLMQTEQRAGLVGAVRQLHETSHRTLLPMLLPSSPNNSSLKLSSCLSHPGGNSQPFLLSFSAPHLTILVWCLCGGFGSHLQALPADLGCSCPCASSPSPLLSAGPRCLSCSPWALPGPRGCLCSGR